MVMAHCDSGVVARCRRTQSAETGAVRISKIQRDLLGTPCHAFTREQRGNIVRALRLLDQNRDNHDARSIHDHLFLVYLDEVQLGGQSLNFGEANRAIENVGNHDEAIGANGGESRAENVLGLVGVACNARKKNGVVSTSRQALAYAANLDDVLVQGDNVETILLDGKAHFFSLDGQALLAPSVRCPVEGNSPLLCWLSLAWAISHSRTSSCA